MLTFMLTCFHLLMFIHHCLKLFIRVFRVVYKMFDFIMYTDDITLFSTIKSINDNIPNKNTESAVNDELLKNNGMD